MTRRLLRDVRVPAEQVANYVRNPSMTSLDFTSEGPRLDPTVSMTNVYSGDTSMHLLVTDASEFIIFEVVEVTIPVTRGWIAWSIRLYCPSGQPITHAKAVLGTLSALGFIDAPGEVVEITYDNYLTLSGSLNVDDYPDLDPSVRIYTWVGVNANFDAPVPVGTEFYLDAALVTSAPTQAMAEARAAAYFDGSTPPPAGMETYWVGEANRSESRLVSAGSPRLETLRRNLAAHPIATPETVTSGVWNGILGGGGGQVETAQPGPLYGVTDYFEVTAVGDSTSSSAFHEVPWINRFELNTDYASSILVMTPRDMDATIIVSDGGQTLHSQPASLLALRWNLIELMWSTLSLVTPDISVGIFLDGSNPLLAGESLRIGRVLHEKGVSVGPYFDGNTSPRTFWESDDTSYMLGYV